MNPPNIGLCGKIASGKTTIADILVERYGYVKLSFATPLKELAWHCAEWLQNEISTDDLYVYVHNISKDVYGLQVHGAAMEYEQELNNLFFANIKPRKFLQHVGTEIFRAADPDVWVKYLLRSLPTDGTPWCVDDCRMLNEIDGLRSVGGVIIQCRCTEWIRGSRIAELYPNYNPNDAHQSETELDGFKSYDLMLDCDTGLDALTKDIEFIIKRWN